MSEAFKHVFRVRYAEVDPQSVVFNSRYLEYADLLVTEYFRASRLRGFPEDFEIHIRRALIDFRAPIRLDELIEGRLQVTRMGNSSMAMQISLHGAEDGSHRADIELVQVHVDLSDGTPMPIPDKVREACGFPVKETHCG